MYDFTGCQCPVCHQLFRVEDDVVVCPDCGTPYHRACYESAGHCLYAAKHGPDFEWTPPHAPAAAEVACPRCGTANPVGVDYCKTCGASLASAQSTSPNASANVPHGAPNAQTSHSAQDARRFPGADSAFDYASFYASPYAGTGYTPAIDPNETMEGIPAAEWVSYIGRSSRSYLNVFKQMEVLRRKYSLSFSAMLFGPLYFFYRKAWLPAFVFSFIELMLGIPSVLILLFITESTLTAGMDANALNLLARIAQIVNLGVMVYRGLFGFYFYKKSSAARIRRIEAAYPDPDKRSFVLNAQGGTSIAAVLGALFALIALCSLCTFLLGPNVDALLTVMYA